MTPANACLSSYFFGQQKSMQKTDRRRKTVIASHTSRLPCLRNDPENPFPIPSSGPISPSIGHNLPWTRQRNYSYASSSRTNSDSKPGNFVLEERSGTGSEGIAPISLSLGMKLRYVLGNDSAVRWWDASVFQSLRKTMAWSIYSNSPLWRTIPWGLSSIWKFLKNGMSKPPLERGATKLCHTGAICDEHGDAWQWNSSRTGSAVIFLVTFSLTRKSNS